MMKKCFVSLTVLCLLLCSCHGQSMVNSSDTSHIEDIGTSTTQESSLTANPSSDTSDSTAPSVTTTGSAFATKPITTTRKPTTTTTKKVTTTTSKPVDMALYKRLQAAAGKHQALAGLNAGMQMDVDKIVDGTAAGGAQMQVSYSAENLQDTNSPRFLTGFMGLDCHRVDMSQEAGRCYQRVGTQGYTFPVTGLSFMANMMEKTMCAAIQIPAAANFTDVKSGISDGSYGKVGLTYYAVSVASAEFEKLYGDVVYCAVYCVEDITTVTSYSVSNASIYFCIDGEYLGSTFFTFDVHVKGQYKGQSFEQTYRPYLTVHPGRKPPTEVPSIKDDDIDFQEIEKPDIILLNQRQD